jgi:hypothetical protein
MATEVRDVCATIKRIYSGLDGYVVPDGEKHRVLRAQLRAAGLLNGQQSLHRLGVAPPEFALARKIEVVDVQTGQATG